MNDNAMVPVNAISDLVLACDVSKADVHTYAEVDGMTWRSVMPNTTAGLEDGLRRFVAHAKDATVVVVMESTGSYHENLIRVARSLGLGTAWVMAEGVARVRVAVHGDQGKTDRRDTEVIHALGAKMKRRRVVRELPLVYRRLREWHRTYEAAEDRVVELKGAVHTVLQRLFPDFDFKVDFLFGRSGQALAGAYGCNPHRIVADGRVSFSTRMKTLVPRIQAKSLQRLFTAASESARGEGSADVADVLALRVQQLFEDLQREEVRLLEARANLEELYAQARLQDPRLPDAEPGIITRLCLARVVAETGPLSDFQSWRALLRYAGYNLMERQSGQYRGKTRISKKGRRLLRKVLNHAVLPLVKKERLFGPFYHGKRAAGMPGAKAMTTVARKILKMLWGWYQSASAFNPARVFACTSTMEKAA